MSDALCAPAPALVPAERFTLWIVRRAHVLPAPWRSGHATARLTEMAAAFREALQPLPVSLKTPSREEHRLLRATAAVQIDDLALADNFLFKLALARAARSRLTQAVITLADLITSRGHVLALPTAQPFSLPGAALQVARMHGCDLRATRVTWPQTRSPQE